MFQVVIRGNQSEEMIVGGAGLPGRRYSHGPGSKMMVGGQHLVRGWNPALRSKDVAQIAVAS
jgi:hypothetical protein